MKTTKRANAWAKFGITPGSLVELDALSRSVGTDVVTETGHHLATRLFRELSARNLTLAVAESLTGGLLSATIVSVPGVSAVFRGGAVTYATDTKASVLGVSRARLALTGPVDEVVAEQMADGVQRLYQASLGVSTTGVAGPGSSDGHRAGTVWIGVSRGGDLNMSDQAEAHDNNVTPELDAPIENRVKDTFDGPNLEESRENSKGFVPIESGSTFLSEESGKLMTSNGDGGCGKSSALAWRFEVPGDRVGVRELTVKAAISLLLLEVSTIA